MEIIMKPRCTGKTLELIQKVKDDPHGVLIVHSATEMRRLKAFLPIEKIDVFNPLKFQGTRKNLYIDNADMILQSVVSRPIKAITLTKED